MGYHAVDDYELWIDSDKGTEHMLLVSFTYQLVDEGIGWNEWCGIPSYDSCIVPEIELDSVDLVSTSGERKRTIHPGRELINRIIAALEEDYNFIEED